jgi:hypothetical protein
MKKKKVPGKRRGGVREKRERAPTEFNTKPRKVPVPIFSKKLTKATKKNKRQ